MVEVKKEGGVEKGNLASGVVVADVIVPSFELQALCMEGSLENGDSVEEADDEP